MTQKKFTGTGVAIITPFRKDRSIDFKSLEKLLEHLINNGIDYIVALGTTGESATLSKDEKNAVVSYVIEVINNRVPLVVGMGGNNTQEIVNSIKSNSFKSIDAILSVAPYYNKPSQAGLYEHFKSIADASPVPVILYNVPGRTSSNISAETTVKLAREVNGVIAIKEASGNLSQIMNIVKNKPRNFLVISGDDILTLPMIAVGCAGVISVAANAYPKEISDMVNYALKNDMVRANELHYKLLDLIEVLFEEGNPSGIKAALDILKICPDNLRLPLLQVSDMHYKKISDIAKKIK
jgi:4-hydroxy-tetrahydrodipicolinate synthase